MNRTEIARNTLALMTVAELRDLAREAGLRGRSAMRKAELVAALLPAHLAEMAQVATNRAPKSPAEAQADWARATDSGDVPHSESAGEVRTPADVWARVAAAKEAAMAELRRALPQSGYTDCACRDCPDAAISSDVTRPEPCQGCAEDECELGDSECNRAEAYGC